MAIRELIKAVLKQSGKEIVDQPEKVVNPLIKPRESLGKSIDNEQRMLEINRDFAVEQDEFDSIREINPDLDEDDIEVAEKNFRASRKIGEFYSPLKNTINQMSIGKKGTKGENIQAYIEKRSPNVTESEKRYANIKLDPKKKYTREEVLDYDLGQRKRGFVKTSKVLSGYDIRVRSDSNNNTLYSGTQRMPSADTELDYFEVTVHTPVRDDTAEEISREHFVGNNIVHSRASLRESRKTGEKYLLAEESQSDVARIAGTMDEGYEPVPPQMNENLESNLDKARRSTAINDIFYKVFGGNKTQNKLQGGSRLTRNERDFLDSEIGSLGFSGFRTFESDVVDYYDSIHKRYNESLSYRGPVLDKKDVLDSTAPNYDNEKAIEVAKELIDRYMNEASISNLNDSIYFRRLKRDPAFDINTYIDKDGNFKAEEAIPRIHATAQYEKNRFHITEELPKELAMDSESLAKKLTAKDSNGVNTIDKIAEQMDFLKDTTISTMASNLKKAHKTLYTPQVTDPTPARGPAEILKKEQTPITTKTETMTKSLQSLIALAKDQGVDKIVIPNYKRIGKQRTEDVEKFRDLYEKALKKSLNILTRESNNTIKVKSIKYDHDASRKDLDFATEIDISEFVFDPKTQALRFDSGGMSPVDEQMKQFSYGVIKDKVGEPTGKVTRYGRPVFRTEEGKDVSELGRSIPIGDKFYNTPSIFGEKLYSEDSLRDAINSGIVIPTGIFDTEEQAVRASKKRSDTMMDKDPKLGIVRAEGFSEGGLRDEGGEIEPKSGNKVPSGSLKKEVADDIPAMISEGEFIFPADVTRYIGLETLMKMRQDAKQGLKMMEEMGQMGNSDEATIPDDIPFDMADLIVVSSSKPKKMQTGGLLNDPRFTSQTTPTTPTLSEEDKKEIEDALVSNVFGNLIMKRFVDADGNVRYIPFIDGEAQMPIPEGFTEDATPTSPNYYGTNQNVSQETGGGATMQGASDVELSRMVQDSLSRQRTVDPMTIPVTDMTDEQLVNHYGSFSSSMNRYLTAGVSLLFGPLPALAVGAAQTLGLSRGPRSLEATEKELMSRRSSIRSDAGLAEKLTNFQKRAREKGVGPVSVVKSLLNRFTGKEDADAYSSAFAKSDFTSAANVASSASTRPKRPVSLPQTGTLGVTQQQATDYSPAPEADDSNIIFDVQEIKDAFTGDELPPVQGPPTAEMDSLMDAGRTFSRMEIGDQGSGERLQPAVVMPPMGLGVTDQQFKDFDKDAMEERESLIKGGRRLAAMDNLIPYDDAIMRQQRGMGQRKDKPVPPPPPPKPKPKQKTAKEIDEASRPKVGSSIDEANQVRQDVFMQTGDAFAADRAYHEAFTGFDSQGNFNPSFYVGGVPTKPMKPQRLKKGGLAKPKVKPKRMKKGGLASKK